MTKKKKPPIMKKNDTDDRRMESRRIYLDHAATTPLDREVLEKMLPYYIENFGNADSPHSFGRKAMTAVDIARDKVAELLNAQPSEIYFTSGGTESDNWGIVGGALAMRKKGKTKVLMSNVEHHAALAAAEKLASLGLEVVYLPVNASGRVEIETVRAALDESVGLVCVMYANNETGVVQPIKEIAALCKEKGSLFFTDCVQAAPHRKLDVKELGADMLSLSSHKFYGPKGVGVLYIKKGVSVEKFIAGGEQERGLRGGTLNVAGIVGLSAALEKSMKELEEREAHILKLREKFVKGVKELGGVINGGEQGEGIAAVVNVRFDGVENAALLYNLDLKGIAVAAGSACASMSILPSHVLSAMGLTNEQAKSSIRVSFGKGNTEEEVERVLEVIKATLEKIR